VADKVWTPVELIRWTETYLAQKGLTEPRLNAELLLCGVLGLKRLDLYLQFDRPLRGDELAEFKARLRRRTQREPLQYIEGVAAFRRLELRVDRRVLIPRPETELLVGEVLAWAGDRGGLEVLDVGTGSGAIALSLAQEGRFARVVATDVSLDALEVARANAISAQLEDRVEFVAGSLFEPILAQRFDIIVSNPPYVGEAERHDLEPEVVDWEPHGALFAGLDGLSVIRDLVGGASSMLRPGGLLAIEVGSSQAVTVSRLLHETGWFAGVRVRQDYTGRERFLLTERTSVSD
jgi:release factor glutamine methyltransferase